jgi:hypothetical protein
VNLKEIVNKLRNTASIPEALAPAISDYKETISTKRSVRFLGIGTGGDGGGGGPESPATGGAVGDAIGSTRYDFGASASASPEQGGGGGGGGGVSSKPVKLKSALKNGGAGSGTALQYYDPACPQQPQPEHRQQQQQRHGGRGGSGEIYGGVGDGGVVRSTSSIGPLSVVYEMDKDADLDHMLQGMPSTAATGAGSLSSKQLHAAQQGSGREAQHTPAVRSILLVKGNKEMHRTLSDLTGLSFCGDEYVNTSNSDSAAPTAGAVAGSRYNDGGDSGGGGNGSSATSMGSAPYRMKAHEALQIGLILSQQEHAFGTNMYQSLTSEDEPEIARLNKAGFSVEEAILQIFNRKFLPNFVAPRSSQQQVNLLLSCPFAIHIFVLSSCVIGISVFF